MKFFITERGELAHQLKQADQRLTQQFNTGDALLAISKNANNPKLHDFLLKHQSYTIFHATITGMGGSIIEPGVPHFSKCIDGLHSLIKKGFPAEQIILRIDPIVPTEKGIQTARAVLQACPEEIKRIRFSFIDQYRHTTFVNQHLPWQTFHAPKDRMDAGLSMLKEEAHGRSLEACGEPSLSENKGCISPTDYQILGLPTPPPSRKGQRAGCLCLGNKTELLTKPARCPNHCRYCYYNL